MTIRGGRSRHQTQTPPTDQSTPKSPPNSAQLKTFANSRLISMKWVARWRLRRANSYRLRLTHSPRTTFPSAKKIEYHLVVAQIVHLKSPIKLIILGNDSRLLWLVSQLLAPLSKLTPRLLRRESKIIIMRRNKHYMEMTSREAL